MEALIIINPKAGKTTAYQMSEYLCRELTEHGYHSEVRMTAAAGDAERFVSELADEYDLLLCVGGDGTLNETVNGLGKVKNAPPIAYIPAGTTNDFANSMGLSGDYRDVVKTVFSEQPKSIDVGSANGRRFIYSATFGAFVPSSYLTSQNLKNYLGKLAYYLECARELPSIRPYHMTIADDSGLSIEGEFVFGAVSSATSIGGVLHYDHSEVDFSDGMHEVLLIRYPKNITELSTVIRSLIAGDFNADGLEWFKSSSLRFVCDDMPDWALDGEQFSAGRELVIKNIPRAVKIFVPGGIAAVS